jgi:hypothetical protein
VLNTSIYCPPITFKGTILPFRNYPKTWIYPSKTSRISRFGIVSYQSDCTSHAARQENQQECYKPFSVMSLRCTVQVLHVGETDLDAELPTLI